MDSFIKNLLCRSYEDVEESAKDNLLETKDGKRLITKYQLFSLKHREDLLEHCPSVDVQEMKQIISETLEAISGMRLCLHLHEM